MFIKNRGSELLKLPGSGFETLKLVKWFLTTVQNYLNIFICQVLFAAERKRYPKAYLHTKHWLPGISSRYIQYVHLVWVKVFHIFHHSTLILQISHWNKKWSFIKANSFCTNDHHCKLTCRLAFYAQIYHPFPAGASQIAFWQICILCV